MLLYIAATNQVVISVLVVERGEEGKAHGVKRPVYYLSEVLSPTKQRYPHYQKLAYTIYITGKKLPLYFECHSIVVVASTRSQAYSTTPTSWDTSFFGASLLVHGKSHTSGNQQSSHKSF
jgi:hypothetical protein